jgi:hypothetical protein
MSKLRFKVMQSNLQQIELAMSLPNIIDMS